MSDAFKGIIAIVAACTIWGLSPLYYAQLKHVPPLEVLCYRGLWSLVFFGLILGVQRRQGEVWQALRAYPMMTVIAAIMISANWFVYIFAITSGQGVEASLGYYIFPLVAVLLGRVFFAERLSGSQWAAIVLATVAVLILTVGLGVAPWIALLLAGTFGAYGLLKKRLPLGPVVSVTAEVAVLAPLAVLWLVYAGARGEVGYTLGTHALLAFSGPLTATPLILFSFAARRVTLSTLGVVQYLNPTLQFSCAVLVFAEPFTEWHAIAFPLIWVALLVYSIAAIRQDRASRRRVSSAAMSGTAVTKSSNDASANP